MALKHKIHDIEKASTAKRAPQQEIQQRSSEHLRPMNPAVSLQRAANSHPSALKPADIFVLQRTIGNRAVGRFLKQTHALPPPQSSIPANALQLKTEEEETLQRELETTQRKENRTGLPDGLKTGIENLSGMAMDDVLVHYNSSKPAGVQALAYTQGTDIHVGPGQEHHLPHEAWHVVQQKHGRVAPTAHLKGVAINDDARLEQEANEVGEKAAREANAADSGQNSTARKPVARPTATAHVVQRDVGFEYETNADTYLAANGLTDPQRQANAVPPGAAPLTKGDPLVINMNGLHAKADLGGAGLGSNLELETDPFPETAAGRVALHQALKNLERFCNLIDAKRTTTPHLRSTHLAAALGGNAPVNLRYIHALANIVGNPQTTAGVRLDKVEELMERTVGGPTGGPHVPGLAAPLARLELGVLADFQTVGDAPRQVRAGIATYANAYAGVLPLPGGVGFPSDALVGLCSLLLSYIIRGTLGQMYAKQIAPLMARTDFGTIFANDLPPLESAFLSAGGGAEFVAMFTAIVNQAGVAGGIAGQLFASEPASVLGMGLVISGSLTRQAWIAGISQNNDLLTPTTFPSVAARPQMFGLGELGGAHDPDPTGGGVPRPILELRRMMQHIAPHDFTEMAMGVFDYIVALNAAGPGVNPAYQRVARAQKQPKAGQKLSYKLSDWLTGG